MLSFLLILEIAARLVLSAVFAVSGAMKLRQRESFQRTLSDFGVPSVVAAALALVLPWGELAIAVALPLVATARLASLTALALLVAFSAAVALTLLRGRRPPCQCFGALSPEPIGWTTLVRNAALIGLAVIALAGSWGGGTSLGGAARAMLEVSLSPSQVAAAGIILGLIIGQTWLIGLLLSWVHRLSIKVAALESRPIPLVPGLPVGAPAPPFTAPSLKGGSVSLADLLKAGKPIFLFFFDVDCGPCKAVFPHIAKWQIEHAAQLQFVLLGRNAAKRVGAPEYDAYNVLSQEDREVAQLYKVPSIPSALMIRKDGRIGSQLAVGHAAIEQLIKSIAA